MSQLIDFYRGESTDSAGRFLRDIWSWNDEAWEEVHDFIQWLFPLPEPSRFNADAPLLTQEDITAFRSDRVLQSNSRKSLARALAFLGLTLTEKGAVVVAPWFSARVADVWSAPNHNWLRITRILRSLRILGLTAESADLFGRLEDFYRSGRFRISADTFRYWEEAVAGSSFH